MTNGFARFAAYLRRVSVSRSLLAASLMMDGMSFRGAVFDAKASIMRKSAKAALLSALVFPGVGHFFLHRPITGTILAGAALGSLSLVISRALETALQVAEQVQSGEGAFDIAAVSRLLAEQSAGSDLSLFDLASAVFVAAWLVGILDSYRVGLAMDKADAENG